MPAVRERFKTYEDFAGATLDEIYGDRLKTAYRVESNSLESVVWINEFKEKGEVGFRSVVLPWEVQLSPVNDFVTGDFDGNGKMEVVVAQNHFTNWLETGVFRGNPGCHLEWGEDGFVVIPHRESGIVLPGDTKALVGADLDGDGKWEILAGQNNGGILRFKVKER